MERTELVSNEHIPLDEGIDISTPAHHNSPSSSYAPSIITGASCSIRPQHPLLPTHTQPIEVGADNPHLLPYPRQNRLRNRDRNTPAASASAVWRWLKGRQSQLKESSSSCACRKIHPAMRYTAITALAVAVTFLVCWGHYSAVGAQTTTTTTFAEPEIHGRRGEIEAGNKDRFVSEDGTGNEFGDGGLGTDTNTDGESAVKDSVVSGQYHNYRNKNRGFNNDNTDSVNDSPRGDARSKTSQDQPPLPWLLHRTGSTQATSKNLTHMCIPEHKYVGLSAAIHRLEEELRIVTNLTFINAGNHTIPTTTYEGFTQQLSLIKDILKAIEEDEKSDKLTENALPKFRHINFTDLLPVLPVWDITTLHSIINITNSSLNQSINLTSPTESQNTEDFSDTITKYHHQESVFLHMLIEFLLNLQQNFENFLEYVEKINQQNNSRNKPIPISTQNLEDMELRFEHYATSILDKISKLEHKLEDAETHDRQQQIATKTDETVDGRSVASPVWKDNAVMSINESAVAAIEDKLDVLHEKFVNFAKDTEERLETLESQRTASGGAGVSGVSGPATTITASTCNGSSRHLLHSACYAVPQERMPVVQGTGGTAPVRLYTWWDARYECKRLLGPGADLAMITTQGQMDGIQKMLHNHFGALEEFWLGGSDLDTERAWMWVNGHPLGHYNNWANAPYNNPDQNCMSMLRGYKWTDEPCFYERTPLCMLQLH